MKPVFSCFSLGTVKVAVAIVAIFGGIARVPMLEALETHPGMEYHVSPGGDDANDGSASKMLKTISAAAILAQPGDVITVHEGVYRERISPPRGGESDAKRITYQAAPGEKVEIKGSEVVNNWAPVQPDVWKAVLSNSFFGSFNPYGDVIHGDWFQDKGRKHHTGAVYLNGRWLLEAASLDGVLKSEKAEPLWFAIVDKENTTIWARFNEANPNDQLVEINVRRTVFYPKKPGVNFITVRGFTMRHAATPWAPPTAEQIGLIGTNWSKGWVIENNTISHSRCSGVSLGKYGDEWDNKAESAEGYVGTIQRAMKNGWNKETIGHHVVRDNHISHCEQAGIVGSLGAIFSVIAGNNIHDIHVIRLFSGEEMAGIKLHGAIDVDIRGNHVFRTYRGIWLDWMAQGARVTGNLFHDNLTQDVFVEVNHGPFLIDNNIFLSPTSLRIYSQGGAYVNNLISGSLDLFKHEARVTPFHKPHSTEISGMQTNPSGDDRYINNLLINRADLSPYDEAKLPMKMCGNVYLRGTKPSKHETTPLVRSDFDPAVELVEKAECWYLNIVADKDWSSQSCGTATTEMLGKAAIPDLPFERPDGRPLRIDTDYFGKTRDAMKPFPGPFELLKSGKHGLKVWPISDR